MQALSLRLKIISFCFFGQVNALVTCLATSMSPGVQTNLNLVVLLSVLLIC